MAAYDSNLNCPKCGNIMRFDRDAEIWKCCQCSKEGRN